MIALAALLCIAVGAGASGALNMWYDADIDAQMSRTRELRNSWILRGERGTLEVERRFGARFRWSLKGMDHDLDGRPDWNPAEELRIGIVNTDVGMGSRMSGRRFLRRRF